MGGVEVARGEVRPRVDDTTRHLLGYALALGAASLWGISGMFSKLLFERGLTPSQLAEVRALLGFLMFAGLVAAWRRPEARVRREHLPLLVVFGVVGMAGVQWTYYEAIGRLPLALAVLLQYLAPIFMLVYFWLRGRRVGRRLWVAALLTFVGCYFAVGAYDAKLLQVNLEGTLIALLAALIFAFYLLLAERIVRAYSAWTLLLYGFGFAALAWTIARPWWTLPFASWDGTTYLLIVAVAIFGTLVPFFLSSTALAILPATRVGLTETVEPVVAGIAAFLVLGEALAGPQLVGAGLVLAGIALARSVQPTVDGV